MTTMWRDIESGELVTAETLMQEYLEHLREEPQEYENVTFWEFVENCMTRNNGTLEEV